eukprot:5798120-Amphidinium_carterae.1
MEGVGAEPKSGWKIEKTDYLALLQPVLTRKGAAEVPRAAAERPEGWNFPGATTEKPPTQKTSRPVAYD